MDMKTSQLILYSLLASMLLFGGCAPSVTVTQAGSDRQFEITVNSNDFTSGSTEDFIAAWHQKAREACSGRNYNVISRDIVNKEAPFNELVITGIVECE
jgi:hypothetical protein